MDAGAELIPIIDLFAGPGGLGEGFSSNFDEGQRRFRSVLSIEKETSAHWTLQLRAFFRMFPVGQAPEEYYQFAHGEITLHELYAAYPDQAKQAAHEAWCVELGELTVTDVRKRIETALDGADPWVLLGGPPCQPFSLAGRSRNVRETRYSDGKETRHQLYVEYLQIIADFWPAVFVMENVRGLLTAEYDGIRMFDRIVEDLCDPGTAILRSPGRSRLKRDVEHRYQLYPLTVAGNGHGPAALHDYLVKSEVHGVPQARHRLVIVGVRDDIVAKPNPLQFSARVNAGKVLSGLPSLRSGLSKNDSREAWRRAVEKAGSSSWLKKLKKTDEKTAEQIEKAIQHLIDPKEDRGGAFLSSNGVTVGYAGDWYLDKRLRGVCNHQARAHMDSDLHRYLFAASFAKAHTRSPKLADFPEKLLPDHASAWQAFGGSYFADRFRVQLANRPSTTVVSHIAKDGHYYIHPDPRQCRSLTVREAARLQTFPDNYLFLGSRTQQYTQVGNAVPPILAKQVAVIVHDLLIRSGKI